MLAGLGDKQRGELVRLTVDAKKKSKIEESIKQCG